MQDEIPIATTPSTPPQEQLLELLARWEEAHEKGIPLSAEQLAAADPRWNERPEWRSQLQSALDDLERFHRFVEGTAPLPQVPGFEVLQPLGHGGMGEVYLAWQQGLERIVALKLVRGGRLAGPRAVERFRTEARKLAGVRHPHVVEVFACGEAEGLPYYAMELLEGGDLKARWAGEPQSPREVAELVEKLARGVHAAHEKGVIHRDLKPANVLLASDGTPKVADFGLAKVLDDQQGLTRESEMVGTDAYMAPEQVFKGVVDRRTDVYALGAILYEGLTARPPFSGATAAEVFENIRARDPLPPVKLVRGLDADLQTICLKCLEKDPHRRYATAALLADDLWCYLHDEPIAARSPSAVRQVRGAGCAGIRSSRRAPS